MAKCENCMEDTVCEGVEYGDKCIFHCGKSDEVRWGNPGSEDVKRFWRAIRGQIKNEVEIGAEEHNFENYIFPIFEEMRIVSHYNNKDDYSDYHSKEEKNFWAVDDTDRAFLIFSLPVNFRNTYFANGAYFARTTFSGYANFNDSLFKYDADFRNINISGHFSFHHASVQSMILTTAKVNPDSIISFIGFDINGDFDFSSNRCCRRVSFLSVDIKEKTSFFIKNTKCEDFLLSDILNKSANIRFTNIEVLQRLSMHNIMFDKTEFNGLSLEKAERIELENTSFIGAHLTNINWGEINDSRFKGVDDKPLDRQMARQLKSINDAQGETVIANDFYALEMGLRSKELNWREHFGEKLVQNIHGLVSNHSNDWVLPTIWFFVFGLLFATLAKYSILKEIVLVSFLVIGGLIAFADKIPAKNYIWTAIGVLTVSFIVFVDSSATFEFVAALVNPLNFKDSKDLLGNANLVLIYACRIIEVFIGYQIITAIRKNTRRK
jgi:hypothetical protein